MSRAEESKVLTLLEKRKKGHRQLAARHLFLISLIPLLLR